MRLRTWALLGAAVLTVTAGAPLLALETGGATGPPSWPASLAPYAGVLTSHRGVPPQSVEDRTAFSGRPTARVTDAKGTWRAYLQALGGSGGASLYQLQDNADGTTTRTLWTVDEATGKVAWGPHTDSYPTPPPTVITIPKAPAPNGAGPASLHRHGSHQAVLASYDIGVGDDVCQLTAGAPALVLYVYWWVQGAAEVDCTWPTYILLGANLDQVGWDLRWHPLGSPNDNSARQVFFLAEDKTNQCLNFETQGNWPFRTAGLTYVEWNGMWAGGGTYGPNISQPCQNGAQFSGTVA